ncbi:hypothetical protein [Rhodopirellula europaea]|uniref:hypothetical protein n=1 Tax=Rhodopirellula europaea TaxID=1263866 RepID=UPI003D266148|tara:strand:+ start:3732 stop:4676 length:945 start_codon:yes stop_codon:yes gene_type:complete
MRYSFFIFLITIGIVARADDSAPGKSDAIALFEGLASNWEGLDQFDVSVTVKKFSASPSGKFRDQVETYRLMADFQANRYCFISHGSRVEEGHDDQAANMAQSTKAFFYDDALEEAWIREFPDRAKRMHVTSVPLTLSQSRFPDIRLIGCYDTTRSFSRRFEIGEVFQAEYHPGKPVRITQTSDKNILVRVDDSYGDGAGRLSRRLSFDLELMVPTDIRYLYGNDQRERALRQEKITWKEMNGVVVPISVQGELVQQEKIGGKNRDYPESYDVALEWFSVNDEWQTDVDPQVLRDVPKLFQLLEDRPSTPSDDK